MNLLDYLKWRKENKQAQKAIKRNEKRMDRIKSMKLEIAELAGEIVGIELKIEEYRMADTHLVFSNHDRVGNFLVEVAKKEGRLKGLKMVLDDLKAEQ